MRSLFSKIVTFFVGMAAGILLCVPTITYYKYTPEIVAIAVPDHEIDDQIDVIMHNVQSVYDTTKTDWTIHLAPKEIVNQKRRALQKNAPEVAGFCDYQRHEIWCVYDAQVVIHEIRHIFEGGYHR